MNNDHDKSMTHSADHGHNAEHGHGSHSHDDHGHSHSHSHPAHGHPATHGDHGHGHGAHAAHGAHGAHGHGDDAHGHGGHGPKKPNRVGLGALLGLVILLGIPSLFSELGRRTDDQTHQEGPGKGLLASYTVSNARLFDGVEVKAFQHSTLEMEHTSVPVVYVLLASGERFMAVDMSALRTLGVSNAAVSLSRDTYTRVAALQPGSFDLKVTGEPPLELVLAGIAPLVIGITPS